MQMAAAGLRVEYFVIAQVAGVKRAGAERVLPEKSCKSIDHLLPLKSSC